MPRLRLAPLSKYHRSIEARGTTVSVLYCQTEAEPCSGPSDSDLPFLRAMTLAFLREIDLVLSIARLSCSSAEIPSLHSPVATRHSPAATRHWSRRPPRPAGTGPAQTLLPWLLPDTERPIPHELEGRILLYTSPATASSRAVGGAGHRPSGCQRPNEARSHRPSPILFFTDEAIPTKNHAIHRNWFPADRHSPLPVCHPFPTGRGG